MSKIYVVIHARGGSKRIPLKNIKPLNGKPLIYYPIQLAKSLSKISRIIVSTDHEEIKNAALSFGAEVPFKRPADLSEDVASELVTLHCLKWLEEQNDLPDIMITLTPATPFTLKADLEKAIEIIEKNVNLDSVITVRKAKEYPEWMIDLASDNTGKTLLGNSFDGKYNVSQNLKQYYYPLGAFFVNRVSSFMKKPSMYGDKWGCVELDPTRNIDIDVPEELIEAQKMMESRSQ